MSQDSIEGKVFDFINQNDLGGLKSHMDLHRIKPDILDSHGMTPLTHACFKGNEKIAQYLIDQGADVNSNKHENGFTALHFAAISGKPDLCLLLLAAGAKTHHVNSVGLTASQIGGFIGNHQCTGVINNYMPKSDIYYYTVSHVPEHAAFLSPGLASALHKLVMQININPVRVAMTCSTSLAIEFPSVKYVLEMLSLKEMRKGPESNEILSFKLHYLAFIINEIMKCNERPKDCDVKPSKTEVFIKKILKPVSGEKYLNSILKECIREFPYRDSPIFQRLVKALTAFKDPPSVYSVIFANINGNRALKDDTKLCATCGEETAVKKCSKCKQVQYCDRECQRLHWSTHKKECNRNVDELSTKIDNVKLN